MKPLPLAGNIAFRMMFSAFPFLIFLTAIAGFIGSEAWVEHTVQLLLSVAPDNVVAPLAREIRSILTVPRADLLSIGALVDNLECDGRCGQRKGVFEPGL